MKKIVIQALYCFLALITVLLISRVYFDDVSFAFFAMFGSMVTVIGFIIVTLVRGFRQKSPKIKNSIYLAIVLIIVGAFLFDYYLEYQAGKYNHITSECGKVIQAESYEKPLFTKGESHFYIVVEFAGGGVVNDVNSKNTENPRNFEVSKGNFYKYAERERQVCVRYIRAEDNTYNSLNKLLSIHNNQAINLNR